MTSDDTTLLYHCDDGSVKRRERLRATWTARDAPGRRAPRQEGMDAVDPLPHVLRGAEPHVERHARTSRPDADADLPRDHPAKPQLAEAHAERRLQRVSPPVSAVEPGQGGCRQRHDGRDDRERGQRLHYPTIAGWRPRRPTGEARITSASPRNPDPATTRHVSATRAG